MLSQFKNNEFLNKSFYGLIFKVLSIILNYSFIYTVTKLYGVESWGIMALCLAVINIFSVFGKLGVDVAILKFASIHNEKSTILLGLYKKGAVFIAFFSLVISITIFFYSKEISTHFFNKPALYPYMKIASLGIFPYAMLLLNSQMYRAIGKTNYFFIFSEIFKFLIPITLILISYFIFESNQKLLPIYCFIAALYITMFISGISWMKAFFLKPFIDISYKQILSTAFPLFLGASSLLIMTWVDTLMLGVYRSETEIGTYNIIAKISQVPTIVLVAVNGILAPKIANLYNKGKINDLQSVITNASKLILIGSAPIFALLLVFHKFLFSFFDSSLIESNSVLFYLLVGQLFNVFAGSVAIILQMIGKQKIFSRIMLIALVINILLNFLLIKPFGINGAAIATSLSLIIWNVSCVVYLKLKLNLKSFYHPSNRKLS